MRCFISLVALLVKVTAEMCANSSGFPKRIVRYSLTKENVFPEPADALYMDRYDKMLENDSQNKKSYSFLLFV